MTIEFKYRIGQIVAWTIFREGQKLTDYGCIRARRVTDYGAELNSSVIDYLVSGDKWLSEGGSMRAVTVNEI
jgi:hypothetical protein